MSEDNIYAPPTSEVEPPQHNEGLIAELKSQSTLQLFLLTILTLGIYEAHYVKSQTAKINRHLGQEARIANSFTTIILVISYVSTALIIPFFTMDDLSIIEPASTGIDTLSMILLIVWAFMARNRMNTLLNNQPGTKNWFHGFWTFLFQSLYFNYKINCIYESEIQTQIEKRP